MSDDDNGTFPPTHNFDDEDNQYLARLIEYNHKALKRDLHKLAGKVEQHEDRIGNLEEMENYERGIEVGRKSLVKWTVVLLSLCSTIFGVVWKFLL